MEKLKNQLDIKNEEIVTLKSNLDESLEKHKNLKIKVRLYKQEKEAQLERKKQKISEMEEDYKNQRQKDREKIMTLKANYEDFVSIFMVLTFYIQFRTKMLEFFILNILRFNSEPKFFYFDCQC